MTTTTITHESHPALAKAFEKEAGFVRDLNSGETINVNGRPMLIARWNLITSKRDLTLWVKCKMKPHRGWKVSEAKKYFGLTGSGQKMLDQFVQLEEDFNSLTSK